MPRSRIEALLASFPKLADSGTQHTTVEQDNVRFVYQPLDELYMVLITNRQSNILQDIDSLHLFAQVVTSTCRSLEEREILRNAYELLSAFDELVTLGYRENLTISQIKTFLEMESHEERIQEIIARVCHTFYMSAIPSHTLQSDSLFGRCMDTPSITVPNAETMARAALARAGYYHGIVIGYWGLALQNLGAVLPGLLPRWLEDKVIVALMHKQRDYFDDSIRMSKQP